MSGYAYFKFARVASGTWPSDHPTQPGTILRQPLHDLRPLPLSQWNEETHEWAHAIWEQTTDPAPIPSNALPSDG